MTVHQVTANFIYGVIIYTDIRNHLYWQQQDVHYLSTVTEEEICCSKALDNETVKIGAAIKQTYRKLVRHLSSENIVYYTIKIEKNALREL